MLYMFNICCYLYIQCNLVYIQISRLSIFLEKYFCRKYGVKVVDLCCIIKLSLLGTTLRASPDMRGLSPPHRLLGMNFYGPNDHSHLDDCMSWWSFSIRRPWINKHQRLFTERCGIPNTEMLLFMIKKF